MEGTKPTREQRTQGTLRSLATGTGSIRIGKETSRNVRGHYDRLVREGHLVVTKKTADFTRYTLKDRVDAW